MYYFYVLQNGGGAFYFGSTSNLRKRVADHNGGKSRYTKGKGPYRLVYYEAYLSKRLAIKRELHIKNSGKERKLLIDRLELR